MAAIGVRNEAPSQKQGVATRPPANFAWHSAGGEWLQISGEAHLERRVEGGQVFLALYENNLTSRVASGKNAGRQLRHDFVVRDLAGPFRLPASGKLAIQHVFALGADWKRDNLGVSACIQNANTGEVYQALQRPVCGG